MKTLKLADGLSLPLDAVTQTIAILAKRRAGKSYTMRRLLEQLHHAGQQIVIVDPKGDQWGVRSSADGKAPGLPVVILGGERGDVPLESTAGEVVAKLVVEERVSALLDLSLFRKHELATFMAIFLETLYRLKAREEFRTPMMLVIDEADAVAPQKPQRGEERMLGAAEDIVRRGGQRGIGCVLVTQRSAVLNKNVLTQAQILIALRTIAPQDLAAMNAWIDVHGTLEQKKTLMESLPALPVGDAWVWSPGWPTVDGIFKRVHILPIETFDSGKSPDADPGAKRIEPKKAADVDLEALKRQMSATIEKAKADDPKELRKELAEAKRELEAIRKLNSMPDKATPAGKPTPVLTDADRAQLAQCSAWLSGMQDRLLVKPDTEPFDTAVFKVLSRSIEALEARHAQVRAAFLELLERKGFQKILDKLQAVSAPPAPVRTSPPAVRQSVVSAPVRQVAPRASDGARPADGALTDGQQKILDTALNLEVRGVNSSLDAICAWMDIHPNGGRFRGNLRLLREDGYLEDCALTEKGRTAARSRPTGLDAAKQTLTDGQLTIVTTLEPQTAAISIERLGELMGIHPNGGRFRGNVRRLRDMGIVSSGVCAVTKAAYL